MKTTASEWNQVRSAFAASLLVDTPLQSLASNLDGPEWPVAGEDETAALYIDLEFVDAQWRLAERGMAATQLDQLVEILRETMAFDAPFTEMVVQTAATESRENELLKNLARLGIPAEFPISLTMLEDSARDFCRREDVRTLGDFLVYAQRMALNVIVGGDFRRLLNAVAQLDEVALAEFLPFRRGATGLHLIEASAHALSSPEPVSRAAEAAVWFHADLAILAAELARSGDLSRYFSVLGEPFLEARAIELLRPHLRAQQAGMRGAGFWRGLMRWWARPQAA